MSKSLIARDWLLTLIDRSPHSNFLISGQSGTGKSVLSRHLSPTTLLTHHCTRFTPDSIDQLSSSLTQTLIRHFRLPKKSSLDTAIQTLRKQPAPKTASQKPRIIIDAFDEWLCQPNASQLLNFLKNLLISHLSPHIQFILTTRSNNLDTIDLKSDFIHISLDFNDSEDAPNPLNTNIVNDAIELTLWHLRANKYLPSNLVSLMRSTTDATYRKLINTIVIKSNSNLLFITKLFDFIKHQKLDLNATVDSVPSTLNGLYLHITDYLFDNYKIMIDSNCVTPLPPSDSWVFHKSFQSSHEEQIDLFHLILGVVVFGGKDSVSREGIFERIQARFGDAVNEYMFDLTFNLMESVIFEENQLFHWSFADFLIDGKFSTKRHCVDFGVINEVFACFYWKMLMGASVVDAKYYAHLNSFKDYLIKCGDKESVGERLSEIYRNSRNRSATKSTLNTISTRASNRNPIRRFFRNAIFKYCCPYFLNPNSIDS